MVHTTIFAVIGVTLLSLAASHPTPDYRAREDYDSHADIHLQFPRLPVYKKYLTKVQVRQDTPSLGSVFPVLAEILTPITAFGNGLTSGIGSTLANGLSTITGTPEQLNGTGPGTGTGLVTGAGIGTETGFGTGTPEDIKGVSVNLPLSISPNVVLTHRKENAAVRPALIPAAAAPFVPQFVTSFGSPYASPAGLPLQYPGLLHGNAHSLSSQHYISTHHILVPLAPRPHVTKGETKEEGIKSACEQKLEEQSIRSGEA